MFLDRIPCLDYLWFGCINTLHVKYSVTASIGAAVFSEDGSDFEALFREADKALYVVKRRGKNDLAFYNDVKDEAESQLIDYRGREE